MNNRFEVVELSSELDDYRFWNFSWLLSKFELKLSVKLIVLVVIRRGDNRRSGWLFCPEAGAHATDESYKKLRNSKFLITKHLTFTDILTTGCPIWYRDVDFQENWSWLIVSLEWFRQNYQIITGFLTYKSKTNLLYYNHHKLS